jgi:hypothetical protein
VRRLLSPGVISQLRMPKPSHRVWTQLAVIIRLALDHGSCAHLSVAWWAEADLAGS